MAGLIVTSLCSLHVPQTCSALYFTPSMITSIDYPRRTHIEPTCTRTTGRYARVCPESDKNRKKNSWTENAWQWKWANIALTQTLYSSSSSSSSSSVSVSASSATSASGSSSFSIAISVTGTLISIPRRCINRPWTDLIMFSGSSRR